MFYCISGLTGIYKSGKFSTWSPVRFKVPDNDDDILEVREKVLPNYLKRPKNDLFYHPGIPEHIIEYTCSTCQFICHQDKNMCKNRYKLFRTSGVIIQDENGKRYSVKTEKADELINNMDKNRKKLFTD